MVRAKFRCVSVKRQMGYDNKLGEVVDLQPVYGEANKPWSEATPQGRLEMTITNPGAQGRFEVGASYYLDFTPAPAEG